MSWAARARHWYGERVDPHSVWVLPGGGRATPRIHTVTGIAICNYSHERGMPSRRTSRACTDCVPAKFVHRGTPFLLGPMATKLETKEKEFETVLFDPKADAALQVLKKNMFKADHPYATQLGYYTTASTSSAGVVNNTVVCSSLSSTSEWTSLSSLFDEFFIHSMELRATPINAFDAVGYFAGGAGTVPGPSNTTNYNIANAGLLLVSLFGAPSSYTSASAMLSNPNFKLVRSGRAWKYYWRNNVKFDPHGVTMTPLTSVGWQGWCLCSEVSNYGGVVQYRVANDEALGDKSHVLTFADIAVIFKVSFRSRA